MPVFDHGAEGGLKFAELRRMQATYQDAQLVKTLKAGRINLRRIQKSMGALAVSDPRLFMQLSLALKRNRVIVDGALNEQRLKELVAAGEEHRHLQERFENSYWGLTGKVVKFCHQHSPTVMAVWALKQQFGKDGVYARNLAIDLQTAGTAAEQSRSVLLRQSLEFAALEANVTEQLARYGLDTSRSRKITEDFRRYFGNNAALAKQVMARLALTAKIANINADELMKLLVEQQLAYGRGAAKTAVDLHLNQKMFRQVAAELSSSRMYASYMEGSADPNIWPELMTQSMLMWHKASGSVGAQLKTTGLLVAEAYRQAAKHGKSQELVRKEADTYIHLARGTSWMRIRLGTQTLAQLEAKARETQAANAGLSFQEATRRVLLARYGQDQLGAASAIFDAYLAGDKAYSPEAIVKLDESLDRTMLGVVDHMQQQWKTMSDDAIFMQMVHAGASEAAAAGTVLTVRAGGLAGAKQHSGLTGEQLENNRKRLKESADFLIDTDITATTSIQRVMAMSQRFIATPLGKLAAAAGLFWSKLALDGYYKVKMLIDWFRAAFAYARIAGVTSAAGVVGFLKQELASASAIAKDLRNLASTAGRIALPTAVGAVAGYRAVQAAEWRVKEADAVQTALKVAKGSTHGNVALPQLADAGRLGDPDKLIDRYDHTEGPAADELVQMRAKLRRIIDTKDAPERPKLLTIGGLAHPVYQQQPLLLTARQLKPLPSTTKDRAAELRRAGTQVVQYQPRTEREAAFVASGIPLTSTGRIAISALAQLESTRRQKEFQYLWLSAMGGDIRTSEQGEVYVRCRFDNFAQLVAGVPIYKALSVTSRT